MKNRLLLTALLLALMPVIPATSYAEDRPKRIHIEKHATTNPELEGMSREERRAYWKKKREERLANMTPEQRQAWEERRRERREKWENMTPEQRRAMRKRWQDNPGQPPETKENGENGL